MPAQPPPASPPEIPQRKVLSLRARLVLLVIATAVPLLAFTLGRQYVNYRETVASTGERTLDLARSMAQTVEKELDARIKVLEVLALSRALAAGDLEAFRPVAESVTTRVYPGTDIVVLDRDGQQLLNAAVPAGQTLPKRLDTTSLRQVFATGRPAVSDLFVGAVLQQPVVSIDVPVKRRDGSVAYVLALGPGLATFDDVLRRQQLPDGWLASVVDRRGYNIARLLHPEKFVGRRMVGGLLNRYLTADEGVVSITSIEGIPLLTVFSHMPSGWAVFIGVPREKLTAPALATAVRTLLAGGGLLLVGLVLAFLVARQITRPIDRLRQLAAAGDGAALLEPPRPTGLREIDEVTQALRASDARRWRSEDERMRAQSALRASEEQLRHAQKMEAVGQLTGGLAHDFNNLLLVITGNLGLLLDSRGRDPVVQEYAREAREAAQRGTELTRSMLAFARRQPLHPESLDVNELVRGIARLLSRTLGERVEVVLEPGAGVWPVVVDPAQLQAALANLATNARDAMPRGGRLTIRTANVALDAAQAALHADMTPGDYVMLEVSDTGTGMTPDVQAQIFEPFFTTKPRGEGTGLGLSMVFGFIKQSGGHVGVESAVDVGTTIRLFLPRDHAAAVRPQPAAPGRTVIGGRESVLLVEDDPAIRRLVMRQLGALGYDVHQAPDAEVAIAVLESGTKIDLVFSDIVMAGEMDGYDLARLVTARWPAIRVVLTSGFPETLADQEPDFTRSFRLLSKPYSNQDLARALREALDAPVMVAVNAAADVTA